MRVGIDKPEKRTRVDAGATGLKYAGIAAIPVEGRGRAVCALVLRCKGVSHSVELRSVGRKEGEAERTTHDPPRERRIGKAQLRPKAVPVLFRLKTVSAIAWEDKPPWSSVLRIDLAQVEIRPASVFLVETQGVLPAEATGKSKFRSDLVAVLSIQVERFSPSIQIKGGTLGGS